MIKLNDGVTLVVFILLILIAITIMPYPSFAADGDLKWSFNMVTNTYGYVYIQPSPAIAPDGTVYIATGVYNDSLYAINPDGTQKWKYTNSGFRASPAIDEDGTIYIGNESDGDLLAIRPNGKWKWEADLTRWITRDLASSAGIGPDGTLYAGYYGGLRWITPQSGKSTCNHSTEKSVYSSPAITHNSVIYVGDDAGYFHSLGPGCRYNWKYKTGAAVKSSPAIDKNGIVYVGSNDGKLYAFTAGGNVLWTYTTGGAVFSSPAIGEDGTIYVGSFDNYLYAVQQDGTLRWRFATDGEIYSSPAVGADGTIYFGSYDHKIYAVNPDGTLKWEYSTGDTIYSSPAIGADGTVYIGSNDGKLYALEGSSGGLAESSPWPMFRHDLRHTGLSQEYKDSDADGIIDGVEEKSCTSVFDADSDDDGVLDGDEDRDRNGEVGETETNPCVADSDGDGVLDGTEMGYTLADVENHTNLNIFIPDADPTTTTDPLNDDTDRDGRKDGAEDINRNGKVDIGESDPNDGQPLLIGPILLLGE